MNTNQMQAAIAHIAHQTLDHALLTGKIATALPEETVTSIAEALLKTYQAGYTAGESKK